VGPNVFCISLAQVRLGDDVTFVTGRIGETGPDDEGKRGGETGAASEIGSRMRVERVSRPFSTEAPRRVLSLHRREPFDVIHVHAACCYSAAFLKRILGDVLLVSHVHGTTAGMLSSGGGRLEEDSGGYMNALRRERIQWGGSDAVVAVSRATSSEVIRDYGVPPERVDTAYNGVDSTLFGPTESRDESLKALTGFDRWDSPTALFVGQIGPRKGLEDLAEAARIVWEQHPEAVFLLAGGAAAYTGHAGRRYYDRLRRDLSSDNFVFLGPVPHTSLPQLYSAVDLLVFPTYYEGFPKAMLEAMACGKPVVSTNVGGIPELARDGSEGYLIQPGDPKGFGGLVCRMLDSPLGMAKMGRKARRRVATNFTWDETARKLQRIYDFAGELRK